MRHVVFLPLLAILIGADTPKRDDVSSDDQEAILGTWRIEKASLGGMELPADQREKTLFEFKKDQVILHRGGTKEPAEYSLNPSKKPAEIRIKPKNEPAGEGIYELNGDTLKICIVRDGRKRPTTFESKDGNEAILMILKREKK
jgi:uncharacterized protein (TIGR03067 family)